MMARDTVPAAMSARVRGGRRATSPTGCWPRSRPPRARAATCAGASRRRWSSCPPRASRGGARVDLRVEDHDDPLAELRRLLGLQRAYELAGAADELLAAGRADEAGALYRRAAELAPGLRRAAVLGRARAAPRPATLDAGVAAVRRAAEVNPDWLVLLDRLSPDFAPAGEAVRRQALAQISRSPAGGTSRASAGGVAPCRTVDGDLVRLAVAGADARAPERRPSRPARRVYEHLLTSRLNVDRVDVVGAVGDRHRGAVAPAAVGASVPSASDASANGEVAGGREVGRVLAVDLVGVQAGGDAGGVGRERRAGGVADLDAAALLADGRELERAAALEVVGADAGLVARVRAAAVDRAAAVAVLLVGLARAVGRVVGDDLGLGAQRERRRCSTGCACRAGALRPSPKPIATDGTPIARMREQTTAARPEKRSSWTS